MEPILRDGATHSDERLREIYGQHAVFSRVENVTLVHLELAWSEDADGRREALERAIASAISTLSDVGLEHPELDDARGLVDEALSPVAASFRQP